MSVVIISGGIGSGKSTVCKLLESEYGWPVYDADSRVKAIYDDIPSVLLSIEDSLNEKFRDDEGMFSPSMLASRIFSDEDALVKVEDIVFPVLTEDFIRWKNEHDDKRWLVLESATILEKENLVGLGDVVVVIDAPLEIRLQRAAERDGVSRESVISRASNQKQMNMISSGEIPSCVNHVVMNDADMEKLRENVRELVEKLT